ncbi:MAG: YczE/YyaS/YitT family protein [Actinomycetota bacterium]
MRFPSLFSTARTIPVTSWRAPARWRPRPRSLVVLILGLVAFGLGEAFVVEGGIGVSPWTVLAQGLSVRLGWSIGWTTLLVGATVLLLWIPLHERPGPGTLLNILVISGTLGVAVELLPTPTSTPLRVAAVLLGIALVGVGSGLYLTCNLGPGPRDGWMTGIHHRTGWPVPRVRFAIEAVVLATGWIIGGSVGVGTLLFGVLVGPSVGFGLGLAGRLGGSDGQTTGLRNAR